MKAEEIIKSVKGDKPYYVRMDVKTGDVEIVDKIGKDNTRYVYGEVDGKGIRNFERAFGGMVCYTTVAGILNKDIADSIVPDKTAANPYFKCGSPMRLYYRKRIDAIIKKHLQQ